MATTLSAMRARIDAFHAWRVSQPLAVKLALVVGWACLMGLLAQARIPLWFTPVPFTMQVFGVLLGGVVLGAGPGALAQVVYVGAGVAGVPWFTGYNAGLAYFLGATGGFLVSFPIAALLVGILARRAARLGRLRVVVLAPAMLAALGIVYVCGMAGLVLSLGMSWERAFVVGVLPFLALDVLKGLAAAGIAVGVGPRERAA